MMKPDEKALLVAIHSRTRESGLVFLPEFLPMLLQELHIADRRAEYLLDRKWSDKGWFESGTTWRAGWLTPEGHAEAERIMDNGKTYTLMCQKAEEIQELCPFEEGDFLPWLPRQDQLQALVRRPIDELWNDFKTWVEVCAVYGEGDWRLRQYKTFDQLWLAFVMYDKFHKRWNGAEWVKEQP